MTCPLLYRFRVIDRLPEPPGVDAYRGTLVHAVLERLFDQPADRRTPEHAESLLAPEWERMMAVEPEVRGLLFEPEVAEAERAFLAAARQRLQAYFSLEDPRRINPAERELYVQAELTDGLVIRGYIDRLDRAADGRTRVVDYKTGRAPSEFFAPKAMFQMKCYALALWRAEGRIPSVLQLLYLGNQEILRYEPDEQDLIATERKLNALWKAVERATDLDHWPAKPSRLCGYCAHRDRCPAWAEETPSAEESQPGEQVITLP